MCYDRVYIHCTCTYLGLSYSLSTLFFFLTDNIFCTNVDKATHNTVTAAHRFNGVSVRVVGMQNCVSVNKVAKE